MNEPHRSGHVQEPDGTPVISHMERLFRIFKRLTFPRLQPRPDQQVTFNGSPRRSRRGGSLVTHMLHCRSSSFSLWEFFKILLLSLLLVCCNSFVTQLRWDLEPRWLLSTHADMMPNFALESQHAKVVRSHSSGTYHPGGFSEMIQSWWDSKHMLVLQPGSPLVPGSCWPFAGDRGHVHIELAEPVHITHFTLGHIKKSQSPTGQITSAPRLFFVYGMKTLDGEKTRLGRFYYNNNGPSFQTYSVHHQSDEVFKHVRLEVEGNWGNTEYTCLYNFRVHGELSHPVEAGGPTET